MCEMSQSVGKPITIHILSRTKGVSESVQDLSGFSSNNRESGYEEFKFRPMENNIPCIKQINIRTPFFFFFFFFLLLLLDRLCGLMVRIPGS
jgi:hypothetical protein